MKKIFFNSFWLFLDKILKTLVGLFVSVWIARYFGPENFGKYSYANSLIILFSSIIPFGTDGIIIREIVRGKENASKIILGAFYFQLVSGFVLFLITCLILYLLKVNDKVTLSIGFVLAIPMLFRFLSVPRYYYEAQTEIKYVIYIENISFLVFSFVRILFLEYSFDIFYFILSFVFESLFSYLTIFLFYLKGHKKFLQSSVNFKKLRSTLKDSFPLFISALSIIIYMKADQLMIGYMLGDVSVGIYSVAVRLSEVWYFIPLGLASSFYPTLIEKRNKSHLEYVKMLKFLHIILFIISLIMAITIQLVGSNFIEWLYGGVYAEAANIFKVYIWSGVFVFIGVAGSNYYLIENKQKFVLIKSLVGLLLNIGLNLIWIPSYGIIGASFATLVSQVFAAILVPLGFRELRELSKIQWTSIFFWNWSRIFNNHKNLN